jgi:hypothetical protein
MISSIQIENFRCFEKLQLEGLSRINLLVGKNGSGKTAFLESLFLCAAGSAEVFLRLRGWRGFGDVLKITYDKKFYESLWRDLFYSFDQSKAILIRTVGTRGADRSFKLFYGSEESLTIPILDKTDDISIITPIRMEWTIGGGRTIEVRPSLTPRGLNVGQIHDPLPGSLFASFYNPNAEENAAHFSELSKQGKEVELIKALNREFPYIQDLSVEIDAGTPMIYATIGRPSIKQKLPLTLISGGINKFVSLLLAIATNSGGVVYVDEIENGFYYDRLSTIWSSLFNFCKQYDVQLIATTHSLECLRALAGLLQQSENDFRLLRSERQDGQCNIRLFSGKELRSAIEQDFEIR